jgi:lysophospholipase L1-like esterase
MAELSLRVAGYSPAYVNAMGSFHQPDPVTGHRGKPNFRGRFKTPEFDVLIVHNDQGFRRQEFQNPATENVRRLCAFGDSFVWGWGVEQGEGFTDQLSRRMPAWRVENYGINGTGTLAQYELFAAECRDHLQPGDVVLLTFYGNDFADNLEGTRVAKIIDGQVVSQPVTAPLRDGWQRTLQESSYLFNYVSYVANRWQLERRIRRAEAKAIAAAEAAKGAPASPPVAHARDSQPATGATPEPESPQPESVVQDSSNDKPTSSPPPAPPAPAPVTPLSGEAATQVAIVRHYLESWQRDCEARQLRLIVAYIPGVGELDEGRDDVSVRREAAYRQSFEICTADTNLEVLDLLPGMLTAKSSGGAGSLIIARDGHWNASGHRVVADIIAARLHDNSTARRPDTLQRD